MPTVPRGVRRPGTLCDGLTAGAGGIGGFGIAWGGSGGGRPADIWKLKFGFISVALVISEKWTLHTPINERNIYTTAKVIHFGLKF